MIGSRSEGFNVGKILKEKDVAHLSVIRVDSYI
jgi:hypothetical protein